MGEIILVTGGVRSGKSTHARKLAESIQGTHVFLATCPVLDQEMAERIARHQDERKGCGWDTVEAPYALADVIRSQCCDVLLIDCLTLWVNNLMYKIEKEGGGLLDEDAFAPHVADLADALTQFSGTVVLVTNEVGLGIVPENELARRYRDLVGRCNQAVAAVADSVVLTVCGIPVTIKGMKRP
ncbi:MAG: bifunctional adenosylcobinamide kinase/adenosylcobinamide-phosphate guanylyltransferase [Lentisphaeria bacterium]|nr:bifunctional adenosylcobinamide kinase/adenosylcobinamide-phosphate guanylyltransferase [Lentisphaeria bacterium]